MTSSKQASRHQVRQRSHTPEPSLPPDIRTGSISLYVDGCPDELGSFFDLSVKVAGCFKPNLNIIKKATPLSTSSKSKSKRNSSFLSSLSTSSSLSSSSSSTLSSGSKEGKEKSSKTDDTPTPDSNKSFYYESNHSNIPIGNSKDANQTPTGNVSECFKNTTYPAYTMTVFLRHMDADPSQRLKPNATPRDKRATSLMKILQSHPWSVHHVEHTDKSKLKIRDSGVKDSDCGGSCSGSCDRRRHIKNKGGANGCSGGDSNNNGSSCGEGKSCSKTNALNRNNSKTSSSHPVQFYHVSSNLPLWSLRQVHHGSEHFRIVLNTPFHLWDDQVKFYSLVLGLDHDYLREDFCLFTVRKEAGLDHDVQFALKRLQVDNSVNVLNGVHIQIKIKDLGKLVALLPNVCQPVSDILWETTDHQGNRVVLNVVRNKKQRRGSLCLEDAVYECMTLPIFNGLNRHNAIFQRVEENSKCTQTSPVLTDSGNDNDYENNNSNHENEKCDDNDKRKVKETTNSKSSICDFSTNGNNCDKKEEECVYENWFEAKYDDLDIYVNCDNSNMNKNSNSATTMCNFTSSTSPPHSLSSITRRVPPRPRNTSTTERHVSYKGTDFDTQEKNKELVKCYQMGKTTLDASKDNSNNSENGRSINDIHNFDRVVGQRSEELKDTESNGYVMLSSVRCNNSHGNHFKDFPMLISDEDFHIDFHPTFSHGHNVACTSIDSVGKAIQEDEESLTLTNLSEESGIIVLQDDDGIWCEGEGEGEGDIEGDGRLRGYEKSRNVDTIRPCLRKHSGNRHETSQISASSNFSGNKGDNKRGQNNSRKVRFSDEIKSFELEPFDDSQSRLSSGFESDEQSEDDAQMKSTLRITDRKYRHRKHSHEKHNSPASNTSSRTFSKPLTHRMIHYNDYDDSVTSFLKGSNSLLSESQLNGNNKKSGSNNIPGENVSNCDNINKPNHNYTDSHHRHKHGTTAQKSHSDISSSHILPNTSQQHSSPIASCQGHPSTPVSAPKTPRALFRPICPPSYEVALATKRKIEQEALQKKRNTSLHRENSNDHLHHKHHHHQQQEPNSGFNENTDINNHTDNLINNKQESSFSNINGATSNNHSPNHHSDLYEESKKLHTVKHASLVCSDDATETHRAIPLEQSCSNNVFRSKTNKTRTLTDDSNDIVHHRKTDDMFPSSVQSTSNVNHNLLTESKPRIPVGILRNSGVPVERKTSERHCAESDDVTTNFTLRFDTCPMSGGQPREEQTGFYV